MQIPAHVHICHSTDKCEKYKNLILSIIIKLFIVKCYKNIQHNFCKLKKSLRKYGFLTNSPFFPLILWDLLMRGYHRKRSIQYLIYTYNKIHSFLSETKM